MKLTQVRSCGLIKKYNFYHLRFNCRYIYTEVEIVTQNYRVYIKCSVKICCGAEVERSTSVFPNHVSKRCSWSLKVGTMYSNRAFIHPYVCAKMIVTVMFIMDTKRRKRIRCTSVIFIEKSHVWFTCILVRVNLPKQQNLL